MNEEATNNGQGRAVVERLAVAAALLFCRSGFEKDCAAEIIEQAGAVGIAGYCRTAPETGYVLFHPAAAGEAQRLHNGLALDRLVFARQWFVATARITDLGGDNRAAPLADALAQDIESGAADLLLEVPDSAAGRAMARLAGALTQPVRAAWRSRGGDFHDDASRRLHACLVGEGEAYTGYADVVNSVPWSGGIPRLRRPRGAPSRAALKLEEALFRFLSPEARALELREGVRAVDLGAAPGGWSWVLARQGVMVTAVDNGPLDERVLATGKVEAVAEDGFRYRPPRPVEWVVCDMVEKPQRVAARIAHWLTAGWARQAIVTLKLPMRQRYRAVREILAQWDETFLEAECSVTVRAKQLYHNREEVTAYLARAQR